MKIFNNQRGDTIMEVLIVVAVLSLILTLSFAITNRSTQGNRQAQERSEAFKYTESQIELLKEYTSRGGSGIPLAGIFCMKSDGSGIIPIAGGNPLNNDFSGFNDPAVSDCKKGDPDAAQYHMFIIRGNNDTDPQTDVDTYTAYSKWEKVGGGGIDEATMVQKLYTN